MTTPVTAPGKAAPARTKAALPRVKTNPAPSKAASAPTKSALTFPVYWDDAKRELMKCDRVLRRIIPKFDGVSLTSRGDPFATLARSITGQQISVQAAQAVWERVAAAYPDFTPVKLARAKVDKLRSCGLSQRKAEYILDLAAHFKQGGVALVCAESVFALAGLNFPRVGVIFARAGAALPGAVTGVVIK